MLRFLQCLIKHKMKPFSVYPIRNSATQSAIAEQGYGHLCFSDKLPLFPNIMVKGSDWGQQTSSERILLCNSAAGIKRA